MEYKYEFEVWRDVPEYFGLYQVSNWGRVKSLNYNHTGKERILKLNKLKNGYLQVSLCKDGKRKMFTVHRLVAMAFIPNPDNLPEVNHKNEIKTDNRVCNLEFCDHLYNMRYGTAIKRRTEKQKVDFINRSDISKPVNQFSKDGTLIGSYPSVKEAERQTGYHNGNICECCNGKRKTHKGYIWQYA